MGKVYTLTMEVLNLAVGGMHCGSCARTLSASLQVLPGVARVDARADTGRAIVTYDPQRAQPAAIRRQIETCGFEILGEPDAHR